MGGLVTLAQHGEHALAELRQMRQCAFASKQLATEFAFKGLDGTRQSRLCHVAAFCGFGQIQRLADRQEVSDMVHFHSTTLATLLRINTDLLGCRHDHLSQTQKDSACRAP
jgi:hypothetical protein